MFHRVENWSDAYTNSANIAGGERWPAAWGQSAREFREGAKVPGKARLDLSYGDGQRNRFDLFLPNDEPRGLVVFVHGGYWLALDKGFWSHLAAGPVAQGYAVAVPSYTLCPAIRIAGITSEIGAAISAAAAMVAGPIMLTGHSAGGHLVSRMICANSPLTGDIRSRIRHVMSLSGLHDLRPLMGTGMNEELRIDEAEALAESPALLRPMENARVTCWAGGSERAEFLRQNALLANIWTGLGAATNVVVEPDRHHYNIMDGLTDPHHPLTRALVECP
ncbi:alpha/beta hydrolase [Mesorhizobium sp. A556]